MVITKVYPHQIFEIPHQIHTHVKHKNFVLCTKVRHNQLMRQQEKMIQDMEKAVYRRETIIYR